MENTTDTGWQMIRDIMYAKEGSWSINADGSVVYTSLGAGILHSKIREALEHIAKEEYERGRADGMAEEAIGCDEHCKEEGRKTVEFIREQIAANKERNYVIEAALPGILEAALETKKND